MKSNLQTKLDCSGKKSKTNSGPLFFQPAAAFNLARARRSENSEEKEEADAAPRYLRGGEPLESASRNDCAWAFAKKSRFLYLDCASSCHE